MFIKIKAESKETNAEIEVHVNLDQALVITIENGTAAINFGSQIVTTTDKESVERVEKVLAAPDYNEVLARVLTYTSQDVAWAVMR